MEEFRAVIAGGIDPHEQRHGRAQGLPHLARRLPADPLKLSDASKKR